MSSLKNMIIEKLTGVTVSEEVGKENIKSAFDTDREGYTIEIYFELDRTPSCEEIQNGICDFTVYIDEVDYILNRSKSESYDDVFEIWKSELSEDDLSYRLVYPDASCNFEGFKATHPFGKKISGLPKFLSESGIDDVWEAIYSKKVEYSVRIIARYSQEDSESP